MSRQARAEPTIGPTRPARSRTTSVLSPAAAPAVPASNALNKKIVKRVVIANLRETEVILDRSAHIVASPKRRFYRRVTKVLESMLICDAIAKIDFGRLARAHWSRDWHENRGSVAHTVLGKTVSKARPIPLSRPGFVSMTPARKIVD